MWLWERPSFQRLRITISMANLSVRLPAIIALVGTQIGLLATQVWGKQATCALRPDLGGLVDDAQVSLPMLLGTGMMLHPSPKP